MYYRKGGKVKGHFRDGVWVSPHNRSGGMVNGSPYYYLQNQDSSNSNTYRLRPLDAQSNLYNLYYENNLCFLTLCWECNQEIFFYRNENGGCAFFDSLGSPWPIHKCWKEKQFQNKSAEINFINKLVENKIINTSQLTIESYEYIDIDLGKIIECFLVGCNRYNPIYLKEELYKGQYYHCIYYSKNGYIKVLVQDKDIAPLLLSPHVDIEFTLIYADNSVNYTIRNLYKKYYSNAEKRFIQTPLYTESNIFNRKKDIVEIINGHNFCYLTNCMHCNENIVIYKDSLSEYKCFSPFNDNKESHYCWENLKRINKKSEKNFINQSLINRVKYTNQVEIENYDFTEIEIDKITDCFLVGYDQNQSPILDKDRKWNSFLKLIYLSKFGYIEVLVPKNDIEMLSNIYYGSIQFAILENNNEFKYSIKKIFDKKYSNKKFTKKILYENNSSNLKDPYYLKCKNIDNKNLNQNNSEHDYINMIYEFLCNLQRHIAPTTNSNIDKNINMLSLYIFGYHWKDIKDFLNRVNTISIKETEKRMRYNIEITNSGHDYFRSNFKKLLFKLDGYKRFTIILTD